MTITLDISPEAEATLRTRSAATGRPLPEIAAELLSTALKNPAANNPLWQSVLARPEAQRIAGMTAAERNAAIDRIIADSPGGPSLTDDALSREEIYD